MKLPDFGLVTDENIDPEVVALLRQSGFDVLDVVENGWQGMSDVEVLQRAVTGNRLVVTHDSDFGTLAILQNEPMVGIIFLRPAHIDSRYTIETFEAVIRADLDLVLPFLIVAKRAGNRVKIRIRQINKEGNRP